MGLKDPGGLYYPVGLKDLGGRKMMLDWKILGVVR